MHEFGELGRSAVDYVPFVSLVVGSKVERPFITRLMEQGVLGIAAAFVAIYVNDKVQERELAQLTYEIRQLKVQVDQMQHDLYVPKAIK